MRTRYADWRDLPFREIWIVDTEYYPGPGLANGGRDGDLITPLCLAAIELRTGRVVQLWQDELGPFPPYRLDSEAIFVSYLLTAEFGFHRAAGWGKPVWALDPYVEFRHLTNDARVKAGDRPSGFYSLAGAMRYLGIDELDTAHKGDMRDRIIAGPPFTPGEREAIQRYNLDDARALANVFAKLAPTIPAWPQALYRGEFAWALSAQERRGSPIDLPKFQELKEHGVDIRADLVAEIDRQYDCFDIDKSGPHFREAKFNAYLLRQGIQWPTLKGGGLDKRGETFRDMANTYPQLMDLHELRKMLGQLRSNKLAVGRDGRNRCLLGPYGTKTGRNAPSNSKFIFGPSKCMRFLIKPQPGRALIYRDYKQQEFRIGAVRSRDPSMLAACESDDVYLYIARQLGFHDASRRPLFKTVVLGILYGLEALSLALRADTSLYEAAEVLARLRARFRVFENHIANVLDFAGLNLALMTNFGWSVQCLPGTSERTIRNWSIQAAGAEIMHAVSILAERRGIPVVAPVHDGFLAEGPETDVAGVSRELDRVMRDASALVLKGYEIPTDDGGGPICADARFYDKNGESMWLRVNQLLANLQRRRA